MNKQEILRSIFGDDEDAVSNEEVEFTSVETNEVSNNTIHDLTLSDEVEKSIHSEEDFDDAEIIEGPKVGMEFDSVDDIFNLYQKHAQGKGFAIVKSRLGRVDGVHKFQTFLCFRERIRQGAKSTKGTACPAKVNASLGRNGKWKINRVLEDHNHEMDPKFSRFIRQHRYVPLHLKRQLELNDIAGIRPSKSIRSIAVQIGGPNKMPFLTKDCRNFIDQSRKRRLGDESDAMAILKIFLKMQKQNKDFFYEVESDDEDRLKNVLWIDARSRAAYQEFGDVVTFDTTYLVNRYNMPFAPFVGVNHHGQSILLGCALLHDEEAKTFTWLFSLGSS